eukprot:g3427.t1
MQMQPMRLRSTLASFLLFSTWLMAYFLMSPGVMPAFLFAMTSITSTVLWPGSAFDKKEQLEVGRLAKCLQACQKTYGKNGWASPACSQSQTTF